MNFKERRRIRKMQKEREKEQNKERRNTVAKIGLAATATAGVAYAGYKYRDEISNVASTITTKATEQVARRTKNKDLQRRVQEQKNVMKAVAESYQQEQGGALDIGRSLLKNLSPEKRYDKIKRRTAEINKATSENIRLSEIPLDIITANREMSQDGYKTFQSTLLKNLENELNSKKVSTQIGDRQNQLMEIARDSTKSKDTNIFRGTDNEGTKPGEVKDSIIEGLLKFNDSSEVEDPLGIETKDGLARTADAFEGAVKRAQSETRRQQKEFSSEMAKRVEEVDLSKLKDNTFAQEKLFEESVKLRSMTQRGSDDFISKSLRKEGWRNLQLKDSSSNVVERDGKLFIDNQTKKGRTLDEVYSPSDKGSISFSDKIRNMAKRVGADLDEVEESVYSSDLFVDDETGEIMNIGSIKNTLEGALDFFTDNVQAPVISINPLRYLKTHLNMRQDDTVGSAIYREGDVSAFTGDTLETRRDAFVRNRKSKGVLDKDYFQIGETIYDGDIKDNLMMSGSNYYEAFSEQLESSVVADGYQILDTRSGLGRRFADTLSGRVRESSSDLNAIQEALGVDPDQETFLKDLQNIANNFEDKSFGQNQPVGIVADKSMGNYDEAAKNIQSISNKIERTTFGLSKDTEEEMHGILAGAINRELGTNEIEKYMFKDSSGLLELSEIMSPYANMRKLSTGGEKQEVLDSIMYEIEKSFNYAKEDPKNYFSKSFYQADQNLLENQVAKLTGSQKPKIRTNEDRLRGLFEEFGSISLSKQGDGWQDEISDNILSNKDKVLEEVSQLTTRAESKFFGKKMREAATPGSKQRAVNEWTDFFKDDDKFTDLYNIMGEIEPFGQTGIQESYESITRTSNMPIKKHRGFLRTINEDYKAYASGELKTVSRDVVGFGQSSTFEYEATPLTPLFSAIGERVNTITGHRGEPTTGSMLPWNLANNLNRGVEKFGLGISSDKRQSAFGAVGNMALYRMAAPIAAYQTAKSLDDFFLGGAGRRKLSQTYANLHLGVADIRDRTGLTAISDALDEYVPGMEHLRGSPVGMIASKATFGLVGDGRSEEELEKYYRRGSDPVRKGRWWPMGSTTPWIGERIEYYRPNAYRRTQSDYQYTDTMHGSRSEYWSNHWMPNIYNPLAPIKHFITDPYHYEEKHEDRRPYAVTGGYASLQGIPVIGSSVDAVFSSIFKPSREHKNLRRAHRDYLRNENESLVSAYLSPNVGGTLSATPRGKVNLTTMAPQVNIGDEESGLPDEQRAIEEDAQFAMDTERIGTGIVAGVPQPGKPGPIDTVKHYARRVLGSFNEEIRKQTVYPAGYNPARAGVPTEGRVFSPSQVHNQVNPFRQQHLDDVVNSTGMKDPAGQFMYAADQVRAMSGFFGYMSLNASGLIQRDERVRLEDSSRYGSLNEGFWSLGLGGYDAVGGGLSEIARRFTGAQQRRQYYNPIRNEMPEWLPGQDYFVDFKHGDPYKKVDYGEIRLPGEAYESIYNVQKDEFGNYSAFDRYRILADVAPYSDQYRFAKSEVALLNQNNLLSEDRQDEYRDIREQVSQKNKKHRFYDRKFGNAKINRETVTVDKVIDQNTFLAKEYPNNPIKLAGVSIKADDAENVALMQSIIKPGRRIEVGLDSDPMNRVRDDMMDTMRAVVYTPKYNEWRKSNSLASGQNVNQFLAGQSEEDGGTVGIKDDGSAVATAALHSEGQITVGKTIETIIHDIVPNVPFLNIVADKFYPVRTATEEYRKQIYSKSFRSWQRPIKDWFKPMLDTGASKNPMLSAVRGAGIFSAFSALSDNQALFAKVGASLYGGVSGLRSISEAAGRAFGDGEAWIPERRERQREYDEYFDRLKYVKYRGLYEQAKEMAMKEEGVDIDAYLGAEEERGSANDKYVAYLEMRKKDLAIAGKSAQSETVKDYNRKQIKEINQKLKEIDDRRPEQQVGSYTALAFRYKEEYESTLYGAKDTYDYMKIYRAMPKSDKEFFTAFQDASPKERQEILKMVPKNQRNIYRQQWGLDAREEDDVSLQEYFSQYELPDADWEGWQPDTSLENIRIKSMRNEGMELTEANYWDEHEQRADMAPEQAIDVAQQTTSLSAMINQARLKEALEGAGLQNVKVKMKTSAADNAYLNTNMNIINQREKEIEQGINNYLNQ